jgi:ankyrin repeat protein
VERFINLGYDINLRADDGCTALHCAARAGQTVVLQVLIQHGAEVDVKNDKSRLPIYEAIVEGHSDCVLLLLEAGTNLNISFWDDSRYSTQGEFSKHVVRTGDCKLVEPVLSATPATQRPKAIFRLLRAAAKIGQIAITHTLLDYACIASDNGSEMVRRTSRQALLHYAVRLGLTAAVEYLLPLHREKETLLRLLKSAAKAGQTDVCKMLLAHSPAIDVDDAMYVASQRGRLPVLEVLTGHRRLSVTARPEIDARRLILAALWNDRLESLRYLASNTSCIAQPNEVQYDVLSRVELVKCLLRHGILKINDEAIEYLVRNQTSAAQNYRSGTLLHLAVEHSDLDLARYLVRHEAFDSPILEKECRWEFNSWYRNVKTALDLAQYHGHTEIANLLIAHGATNRNIAPKEPPQTEQDPAQPPSPNSDSDHEMQDLSDSDTDTDTDNDTDS